MKWLQSYTTKLHYKATLQLFPFTLYEYETWTAVLTKKKTDCM